jgi:integrase
MRITDLIEKYLASHILRPASVRSYKVVAKVFADDLKNVRLEELKVEDLLCWRKQVLARATPSTWNSYQRHIKAMWRWAIKTGELSQDPFLLISSVPASHTKKVLHQDALTIVCDLMAKHPDKYQPAWFWIIVLRFMYATGARRRQVVALRWRDIDWNHAALAFTVEGSKSRKEWQIPLTPTAMLDLIVLRDRSMDHLRAKNRQFQESSLMERQIFCLPLFNLRVRNFQEMNESHLSKMMARLSRDVGFQISPHRIRHTTATRLASGPNPDLKSVQQYLGHSSLLQTLEYVHPDIHQMRLLHDKLDMTPWDVPTSDLD